MFCTLLTRDHSKFASEYMLSLEGSDILLCIMNAYLFLCAFILDTEILHSR